MLKYNFLGGAQNFLQFLVLIMQMLCCKIFGPFCQCSCLSLLQLEYITDLFCSHIEWHPLSQSFTPVLLSVIITCAILSNHRYDLPVQETPDSLNTLYSCRFCNYHNKSHELNVFCAHNINQEVIICTIFVEQSSSPSYYGAIRNFLQHNLSHAFIKVVNLLL